MPAGRPTEYNQDIANRICTELAEGRSLRSVLKDEGMPSMSTVFRWLADEDKEEFREQYALAKEEAADALADDIQDIADKVLAKEYDPQSARVAMDGKKWIASKLKPKRYGEKLDMTSEQTITHKYEGMTDDELERAIQERANRAIGDA